LEKLLWEKPTSQIAKDLRVSEKAIEKHCKKLALKKPPRGYWAKIQAREGK
jgi:biotin operon repressor